MNRFTDNKYKTWLTPSLCMFSISDYNTKMTLPPQVTLVSNLESYGFALVPLARACQQRAGAACGVTRSAGARADQLSLQGDQVCCLNSKKMLFPLYFVILFFTAHKMVFIILVNVFFRTFLVFFLQIDKIYVQNTHFGKLNIINFWSIFQVFVDMDFIKLRLDQIFYKV